MLVLAHAGITLGAATLLARVVSRSPLPEGKKDEEGGSSRRFSGAKTAAGRPAPPRGSWFSSVARYLDIRFLLLGSLLPDIIDKPVGQVLLRETVGNGRIFCHTLLFSVALGISGAYLYRWRGRNWLAALAAGSFMHLVLDQMWWDLPTLLWPLYGFAFQRVELTGWFSHMFEALLGDPGAYVPELVGLAVLLWFGWVLVRRRVVLAFFRRGVVR